MFGLEISLLGPTMSDSHCGRDGTNMLWQLLLELVERLLETAGMQVI
jgi:hypothetical protein